MLLCVGNENLLILNSNSDLTTTWTHLTNALEFLFEDLSFLVRPTGYEQVALEWTI